jgi:DNA-binding transcriptional LysR family regulator
MKLSLDGLVLLDAIARRGSFAAAAAELHRVPSAVTYQVQKLEEDLGVAVFDRRGHRATLTPAGRELLDSGRLLLRSAGELEHRVRRVATGWEAELAIAVDAIVPFDRLWPLVGAFYLHCRESAAAHTRLRFTREVLGGAWDALADRRADFVVGASGDPPAGGGYRSRPLAEVSTVFAVAPSHPLAAAAEPVPEAIIAGHRAVVAGDTSRALPPRTLGLLEGQDTLTVPDLASKLAAQVAGLGCGFLPLFVAMPDLAAGRLVAKVVEVPRAPMRMAAAWREPRPGKALAWWIDAIPRADWAFAAPSPRSDAADGSRAAGAAAATRQQPAPRPEPAAATKRRGKSPRGAAR